MYVYFQDIVIFQTVILISFKKHIMPIFNTFYLKINPCCRKIELALCWVPVAVEVVGVVDEAGWAGCCSACCCWNHGMPKPGIAEIYTSVYVCTYIYIYFSQKSVLSISAYFKRNLQYKLLIHNISH